MFACLLVFSAASVRADEEQDLITLLQSGAGIPQKCDACLRLRIIGTAKSVPALAALLGEERTAHASLNAFETIPGPEAGVALRAALGQSSAPIKVGLIDTLAKRADLAAVPLVVPLLSDKDTLIASAAAAALGKLGGKEATAALIAARDQAPPLVQPTVFESLLKCADRSLAAGDTPGATALFKSLFDPKFPSHVRAAAWRGLVLSDTRQRVELMTKALAGTDPVTRTAALKLVRELDDAKTTRACLGLWASVSSEAQLALLEASLKLAGEALPTVRTASASPNLAVRVAAWQACAVVNDPATIPALAKAAAQGEPEERDAARDALARLRGPALRAALLAQINTAEPMAKAELLRSLGARGDREAASLLLQNAAAESEPVRLAALDSLQRLALPSTVTPLLELAAKSKSDQDRDPVLKALYAVCQLSKDKEQTSQQMIEAMNRFPATQRRQVLPLLSELGTSAALTAALTAMRDNDAELAKEAVRVLGQWPNAAPAGQLLDLARSSANPTLQTLALRGCILVTGHEPDATKRLASLQQAMTLAKRPEEKRLALSQIGQIPTAAALQVAMQNLDDAGLANEAALAAVSIAEKLAPANPQLANDVAVKILAVNKEADIVKRAWPLRLRPKNAGSFIQDWLVCGPYRQADAGGALAVFPIAFGPEKPGEKVDWKTAPRANSMNLMGIFPGQENCAAYARTQIIAPNDCDGVLLCGSDDGIKVWLNGAVVHSNNIDRGEKPDEDSAPIKLKQGANQLLLKITQGGGGWSFCARIVGTDGQPIKGLQVELPAGGTPITVPAPQPVAPPKPATAATLPPRDTFKKLRLTDQFYAEGAYYGDFNKDGKLDVVAGPFWFEGPDFQKRHEYRPAKTFDPKGYSDNFLTYAGDFNGDGWTDILCVPFPGQQGYWYENPAGKTGNWPQHPMYAKVGNESPMWGDVTGDGRPELVFNNDGFIGFAGPDLTKPSEPWAFHAISPKDGRYQQFTHGIGFGDINGDKRADYVEAAGWWEQPATAKPDQLWTFHAFHFADAGAQMLVYDVNGDGLADIITAWHCHLYGLVWWEQSRNNGQMDWKKHVILSPTPDVTTRDFRVSQMHALELVDMNGDGLKDILTGKRYWAHGPQGDKEPDAPAIVYWLELRRDGQGGATFIPHLIDDDSGVGTQVTATDLNGDGRPDVIVANKKGIFVHLSTK